MGGGAAGNGYNGAAVMMDAMSVKALKDLGLDMTIPKGATTGRR